ncbi:MAG: MarR family transcriptional regulator [Methanotrichaceae archaeon]|nr:MarR family transcriptional regulator [Methanotrichaceae archaeon]
MINVESATSKKYIVEACIKAARNKGHSDATGVLRGTLFLEEEPISMDQLVEETGYSKSTVSATMNLLENLGLVKRIVTPGDKKHRYVSITDLNAVREAMMANVRNEIQLILEALDKTVKCIEEIDINHYKMLERINRIKHNYIQTYRLLELVDKYTAEELLMLLEKGGK